MLLAVYIVSQISFLTFSLNASFGWKWNTNVRVGIDSVDWRFSDHIIIR